MPRRQHPLRAWLAEALAEHGVPSDTSTANFILARFADTAEAEACDAYLKAEGLIVRRVAGYKLPNCLRITVGDEPACRRWRMPWGSSWGRAMSRVYDRVALIGLGLIASSMSGRSGAPGWPAR